MAGSGQNDFCGGWLGWLQTAKEKSTAALEMVRKDLAEFGCTMQKDTGHAVEVTSSTLKESLKAENTSTTKEKLTKGLNTFLDGISKAIAVPPDDEGEIPITMTASSVDLYDRTKARIQAIQVDKETYLREPDGSPEAYSRWCDSFNIEDKNREISELLVSKMEVRGLYTKLVPSKVSHVDFWQRYFYKLHQVELDQARKEALMKRAERSRADNSLSWEDDWSGDEGAEDSGSDWERLPRPSQQPVPPDTSVATPVTPAASATTHNASEQRTDTGKTTVLSTEPSRIQQLASSSPEADIQGVSQEWANPLRSEAVAPNAETSEETCRTFVNLQPEGVENLSVPVEETSSRKEDHLKPHAPPLSDGLATEQVQPDDPTPALPDAASQPAVASVPSLQDLTQSSSSSNELALQVEEMNRQTHADPVVTTKQPAAEQTEAAEVSVESSGTALERCEADNGGDSVSAGQEVLAASASDHGNPVPSSAQSEGAVVSTADDWDEDLDVELTEEDMKAAEELAKKLGENINLEADDWENWE